MRDLERDLQRPRLRRWMIDRRRRTWTPFAAAGRSSCSFSFFLRSPNNFRYAFLALKVASQAYTWKISICSAKINHVLRNLLSGELATGRARLRTADVDATSQLQLTEPKEQHVAQCRLCAQVRMSELKSSPGPAKLLDMILYFMHSLYFCNFPLFLNCIFGAQQFSRKLNNIISCKIRYPVSVSRDPNWNSTEWSVITNYQDFNAPKICKITV